MAELKLEEETFEEVVFWLRPLEKLAMEVYSKAAEKMSDDQKFSSFLQRMSDDEEGHYLLLGKAEEHLSKMRNRPRLCIRFDESAKEDLRDPLIKLQKEVKQGLITRPDIMEYVVQIESSEMNYIFIYLFNVLKKSSKTFQYIASKIQTHKERVLDFIDELPPSYSGYKRLFTLPNIWEHRILIVEQDWADSELLSGILHKFGEMMNINTGREGLRKIKENYFDVVICGSELGDMESIEFYQQAVEIEPQLSRRFIFCPDLVSERERDFFQNNHLTCVKKPFKISKIVNYVNELMRKSI